MATWAVKGTTQLKASEESKLSVKQLRKYGLWLVPTVLHLSNSERGERYALSIHEYESGDELEFEAYVSVTRKGLFAVRDASVAEDQMPGHEHSRKTTSSEFRRHVGHLEFAVIATEVWQQVEAERARFDKVVRLIVEGAFARRNNPEITIKQITEEIMRAQKKKGH